MSKNAVVLSIMLTILLIVSILGCNDIFSREARYKRIHRHEVERPLQRDCLKKEKWEHVIFIPAGMGVLFPITKIEKMCVEYSDWY